jgi:hypothetical protein
VEKVKELKSKREVEQEQMEEMRLQMERDAMREQLAGWVMLHVLNRTCCALVVVSCVVWWEEDAMRD